MKSALNFFVLLFLLLPAPSQAQKYNPSIFSNSYNLSNHAQSFPQHIETRYIGKGKIQLIDPVLPELKLRVFTDAQLKPTINDTLEFAAKKGAMVIIDSYAYKTVHIPIVQLDPSRIYLQKINKKGPFQGKLLSHNNRAEVWYKDPDTNKDIFIGSTCNTCQQLRLIKFIKESTLALKKAAQKGIKSVEINLTKDPSQFININPKFTYVDPRKVVLRPVYLKASAQEGPVALQIATPTKNIEYVPGREWVAQNKYHENTTFKQIIGLHAFDDTYLIGQPTYDSDTSEVIYKTYKMAIDKSIQAMPIIAVQGFFKVKNSYIDKATTVPHMLELFRTYGIIISEAIQQNKMLAISTDRKGSLQSVMTISNRDIPTYEEEEAAEQALTENQKKVLAAQWIELNSVYANIQKKAQSSQTKCANMSKEENCKSDHHIKTIDTSTEEENSEPTEERPIQIDSDKEHLDY